MAIRQQSNIQSEFKFSHLFSTHWHFILIFSFWVVQVFPDFRHILMSIEDSTPKSPVITLCLTQQTLSLSSLSAIFLIHDSNAHQKNT